MSGSVGLNPSNEETRFGKREPLVRVKFELYPVASQVKSIVAVSPMSALPAESGSASRTLNVIDWFGASVVNGLNCVVQASSGGIGFGAGVPRS